MEVHLLTTSDAIASAVCLGLKLVEDLATAAKDAGGGEQKERGGGEEENAEASEDADDLGAVPQHGDAGMTQLAFTLAAVIMAEEEVILEKDSYVCSAFIHSRITNYLRDFSDFTRT